MIRRCLKLEAARVEVTEGVRQSDDDSDGLIPKNIEDFKFIEHPGIPCDYRDYVSCPV